nr:MAG TPA: hypothetical protein [Caudoviricetes sp.]
MQDKRILIGLFLHRGQEKALDFVSPLLTSN